MIYLAFTQTCNSNILDPHCTGFFLWKKIGWPLGPLLKRDIFTLHSMSVLALGFYEWVSVFKKAPLALFKYPNWAHYNATLFFSRTVLDPLHLVTQKLLLSRWPLVEPWFWTKGHDYIRNFKFLDEISPLLCVIKIGIMFWAIYLKLYTEN